MTINPWPSKLGVCCRANHPATERSNPLEKTLITETATIEEINLDREFGGDRNLADMTHGRQSRQDAPRLITSLLGPKHVTSIGTWNVRTLYQAGKCAQVVKEMQRYKLKILGLCEVRWLGAGQRALDTGEELLYSGKDEGSHHEEGVGILMAKEVKNSLLEWEAISPRIITARFKSTGRNVTVINAYAPTNLAEDDKKDQFYEQLQAVFNKVPKRDLPILLGDMNAKIGSDNSGLEQVMGRHGMGAMNDNGRRFTEFCAFNKLIIGGSLFPHKDVHKATWISPDRVTENQLDHITTHRKFRTSMLDVRVKRGADIASDHHLLICRLRLKLKAAKKLQSSTGFRYNVAALQSKNKLDTFRISLRNRFEVLEDSVDLDTQWKNTRDMFLSTCKETLGKKNSRRKPWISDETWSKIEDRRAKKEKRNTSNTEEEKIAAEQEYADAEKEVKRSTRRDKRRNIEDLATKAEEAAEMRNTRELYRLTRQMGGKMNSYDAPVKDKRGKVLTTEESQLKRWAEHFKEVLNRPEPAERPIIPDADSDRGIKTDQPSKQEIKDAVKRLKANKAPGPDGIPPEAFKADINTTVEALHKVFSNIWEKEDIPTEWKTGHLVKLPKKGDLGNCNNWRGITLLVIASKVLTRVILGRIKSSIDKKLRQNQAGFRPDRSCTDQIATLRIIVEQSIEWNSPLYLLFIDFSKAFDSLDREVMRKLLKHYGVPQKIINIILALYDSCQCSVIHKGKLSPAFPVNTGVKQGCLLSPIIFTLAVDWIMKQSTRERNGIQWTPTTQLHDLDFADDIVLLAQAFSHLQDKTVTVQEEAAKQGLQFNVGKTKSLRLGHKHATPVRIGDEEAEDVSTFTYLGSVIAKSGGAEEDVEARIRKAQTAFSMLNTVWRSQIIRRKTKLKIFNSNVKSVLLYGSETWFMTEKLRVRLQTFVNKCLRKVMQIFWPNWVTNRELWSTTNQKPIDEEIRVRRWKWLGHTMRKDPSSITRQSLRWNPAGKRSRGRPKKTWRRTVEDEMKQAKLSWGEITNIAQNRVRWRTTVAAVCASAGAMRN